jgi:hypothetical protein
MKYTAISLTLGAMLLVSASGEATAAGRAQSPMGTGAHATALIQTEPTTTPQLPATLSPAHLTGQPNQSCGSAAAPNTPGNAAFAPGSAFNPAGTAGGVYAGQQPQNSRNPASISQYDAACESQP